MKHLLPKEYLLIWAFLGYIPKRTYKVYQYFYSDKEYKKRKITFTILKHIWTIIIKKEIRKIGSLYEDNRELVILPEPKTFHIFLLNELQFFFILSTAFTKHIFSFSYKKKFRFLNNSNLLLLLVKYFDLDILSSISNNTSRMKRSQYKCARSYLTEYIKDRQEDIDSSKSNNFYKVKGYVSAYEFFCGVQDFERMLKLKNLLLLDKRMINSFEEFLITWGYFSKYQKLNIQFNTNLKIDRSKFDELDYNYFEFLGIVSERAGWYESAITAYSISIDILKKLNKINYKKYNIEYKLISLYCSIGDIYFNTHDFRNAIKFYRKALFKRKTQAKFKITPILNVRRSSSYYYSIFQNYILAFVLLFLLSLPLSFFAFIGLYFIEGGIIENIFNHCYYSLTLAILPILFFNYPYQTHKEYTQEIDLQFNILKQLAKSHLYLGEQTIAERYYKEAILIGTKKRWSSEQQDSINSEYIEVLLDPG